MKCKILIAYIYKCIYTEMCIYILGLRREQRNMEDVELMKQLLNPYITERQGEVYRKDEEYQKRLKAEDLI